VVNFSSRNPSESAELIVEELELEVELDKRGAKHELRNPIGSEGFGGGEVSSCNVTEERQEKFVFRYTFLGKRKKIILFPNFVCNVSKRNCK